MAFGRYMTSELGCISFMMLLVTIITSSAVVASSLIAKYTACRRALCYSMISEVPCCSHGVHSHLYAEIIWSFRKTELSPLEFQKSLRHIEGIQFASEVLYTFWDWWVTRWRHGLPGLWSSCYCNTSWGHSRPPSLRRPWQRQPLWTNRTSPKFVDVEGWIYK